MALLPSSSNLNPRIYDLGLGLYLKKSKSVTRFLAGRAFRFIFCRKQKDAASIPNAGANY
jgi:hypothetical protein